MMRPQPRARHRRRERLGQQEGRAQMQRHVLVEGLCRHVREGLAQVDAGGVDENVDRELRAVEPRRRAPRCRRGPRDRPRPVAP